MTRVYNIDEMKKLVKRCLDQLYSQHEEDLFKRNKEKGICERAVVFRFAYYLQNEITKIEKGVFVDCDWNSSFLDENGKPIQDSTTRLVDQKGKPIAGTNRFIDIIVHKRDSKPDHNLLCFEIKKWNNYNKEAFNKDENNLKVLTSSKYQYQYNYGFHIKVHKNKKKSEWKIYKKDEKPSEWEKTF